MGVWNLGENQFGSKSSTQELPLFLYLQNLVPRIPDSLETSDLCKNHSAKV